MRVSLPYGHAPYALELPDIGPPISVVSPPALPAPAPLRSLLDTALASPFGAALSAHAGARVTVIVSDATRDEPRAAFIEVLRAHLPSDIRLTIAIATGTHGPADLSALDLPSDLPVINHDGHRSDDLIELGTTMRGTPVRVHRCLVDTDLVIATGCIRPHYFAGFGAGTKAIFPGLGEATAIRMNHKLKLEPQARAGIVVGNPCRDDLEEAARLLPTPTFLLNGVCDSDDRIHAAVAGDVITAFRAGVELARPWYEVDATPAPLVIASDGLPVTASLYQSAKIAAAAAPFVEPNGTLVLVAECAEGIGPLDTVNEAIFRIGILPRLASGVRLVLVSGLTEAQTNQTLLAYGSTVERILAETPHDRVLVLPHASKLLPRRS